MQIIIIVVVIIAHFIQNKLPPKPNITTTFNIRNAIKICKTSKVGLVDKTVCD